MLLSALLLLETLATGDQFIVQGSTLSLSAVKSLGLVALTVDPTRSDRRGICSGTLIAPSQVLTASHCVHNPLGPLSYAIFGTDAFSLEAPRIKITSAEKVSGADILIVVLQDVAPSDYQVQRMALDVASGPLQAQNVFGAGFGRSSDEDVASGGIARQLSTRISIFERGNPLIQANSGSGHGFCFGDSGGPLFATISGQRQVIGILSVGAQTCASGLDTFLNLLFYSKQIKSILSTA